MLERGASVYKYVMDRRGWSFSGMAPEHERLITTVVR